ncbi:MAG: hypothetical protein NTV59_05765 [Chloroflexi bacterium]|nr:hypothetical protein [Chloroflexota bacterium]
MPDKTKRTKLTNAAWESKKKLRKNKCILCEKSEKAVAELQQAHLRAVSKGGTEYIEPMCPTCHRKYDKGLATQADLKKLGITKRTYKIWRPKTTTGKGTKKGDRTKTATNNAIELDKVQTYLTKQGSEQEAKGIDFGDKAKLKDKSQELEVGRGKTEETVELAYSLPLNIDYAHAIHLDLANKEKVKTSAKLKWIPFFKIFYEVDCRYSDPIKKKHRITDSGFHIVNALLQTPKEKEETQILRKELEKTLVENQSFDQPEEYRLIKLDAHMMQGDDKEQTIDYVIQKNTDTIPYEVPSKKRKRGDVFDLLDSPETRPWILKPLKKDVRIREIQIVYAPKWEIEFQSKDCKYFKSLSGNTGTVFEDNITYCSKKSHEDFIFGGRKKNVAVCDGCGQALCQDHIFKCPACTSWLCEKDSIQCAGCKTRFCADHIKNKCFKCSLDICDNCALKCPICGEIYCNGHMTKCSRCGKSVCVCVSCTRKEGGLFKKTVCKNCQIS